MKLWKINPFRIQQAALVVQASLAFGIWSVGSATDKPDEPRAAPRNDATVRPRTDGKNKANGDSVPNQGIDADAPTETAKNQDPKLIEHVIGAVPFQHDLPLNSIAWLDGGKSLITTCRDGFRVWDVANKTIIHESLHEVENWVYASTDRSGRRIALTGSKNGTTVLEWPSGKSITEIPHVQGRSLALSADGKKLAVTSRHGDENGALHIFDVESGELLAEYISSPALALCWSADSQYLAAGQKNGTVSFLEPDGTPRYPEIQLDPAEPPVALAFDELSERLAIVTIGGTSSVWTVADQKRVWTWESPIPGHNIVFYNAIGGATFSNDGKRLFARSARRALVFEAATAKVEQEQNVDIAGELANIALSPDGKLLARSTTRNGIDLVNTVTLQSTLLKEIPYPHFTRALRISPDQKTLLANGNQRIDVWNAEPFRHQGGLELESTFEDACWSPDSQSVAIALYGSGKTKPGVVILDVSSCQILRKMPMENHIPGRIMFSPDGKQLVVAELRQLSVWDVATASRQWRVQACDDDDWIEKLAISPDGEQFAAIVKYRDLRNARPPAAAQGGEVRLYRASDGQNIGELVTVGTPNHVEYVDDSVLLVNMLSPPEDDSPDFPALVQWDVTTQELNSDDSIAFSKNGRLGYVMALSAKRHQVVVKYGSILSDEIEVWELKTKEQLLELTLPGNVTGAEFLPNNRLAIMKRNGNVVITGSHPAH